MAAVGRAWAGWSGSGLMVGFGLGPVGCGTGRVGGRGVGRVRDVEARALAVQQAWEGAEEPTGPAAA